MIGVVLAGGRSSRFNGIDKTFIQLAGKPLLAHVLDRLRPQVDMVAVNSNYPSEKFEGFGVRVIPDILPGLPGPLAGIHAALTEWPEEEIVTVAVDLPFLPRDLVKKLKEHPAGDRCRYASDGVHHTLAILWPPGMGEEVEKFIKDGHRSIKEWLARTGSPVEFVPTEDSNCMSNINNNEELARAEKLLMHPRI